MPLQRVAVIGLDNMEMGPPVVATLTSHFGERPLHVKWLAPQGEVSEILGSLAMLLWKYQGIGATFELTDDLSDCLQEVDALVTCEDSGARFNLNLEAHLLPRMIVPVDGWPERLSQAQIQSQSFEILRLLNREEYPDDFLRKHRDNRLADWLEELDRS